METGTLSDGLRETLGLFDSSGTPRTTPEVAGELDLGRRTTYARLERLVEEDRLATKKVGASARVWWRPRPESDAGPTPDDGADVTRDRVHAEFEQLVDAVEEYAIFTLDADGYVRSWNPGASAIKGYDAEEILGEHVSTFYTERDRDAGVPAANLDAAAAEGGIEDEGWRVRADGSRFWADVTITPIRDEDGSVDSYATVTRDMTEERRAKAERELLYDTTQSIASAETFEAGLEAALRDICSVTEWEYAEAWLPGDDGELQRAEADYHADDFAEFAAHSTDYGFDSGTGLPGRVYESTESEWLSDLSGSSTDVFRRRDAALDAGLESALGVPVTANGDVVAVLTFLMRESRTHDERLVRLVASIAAELGDLVARRGAEERLRRQRELLNQVFETAPIGLSLFDDDGEMLRANERMNDILDIDPASEQSYTAGDRAVLDADGDPLPFERKPVGRVIETGDPVSSQEVQFPEPDGQTRWLSVNATPMTADGELSQVVAAVTDITRLKEQTVQLERRRDELDAELQEVFGRVDDAFFALDEDWQFTHVNARAARLLERPVGELVGRNVWELFPEAAGTTFQRQYERALENQESVTFEASYGPLDTWFEVSAYPSENGLSVYFRDVAERKERERELMTYERIVETISDGIYVLDEAGQFQLVNEAFVSMTRYSRSELLGRHASTVFGEEFEEYQALATEQFADGEAEVAVFEEEIYDADGTATTVESRFSRFALEEGTGRAGVVRDITERIEVQRELELYATIVETAPDGVYALDEDDRFVLVNEAFCDLVGYDRETLLGAHATLVNSEAVNERANEYERQLEAGAGDPGPLSFEIRTADGDRVPVEGHFRQYSHRDVSGRCGVARDMTERVERERTLEQQREQLTALNNLNEVVREITDAVIEQSSRADIERTVCEHLADSDSYLFAWLGDADPATQTVNLRTEAGVEGYLDDITISVDPEDDRSEGPTGRAFRTGEVETTRDLPADDRYEPWRETVDEYGFRSSAAVPIVHEGTVYGVLNVYAERPYAFEGQERQMFGQIGEIVGHAIAAVERKQALLSDEVVELAFQVEDVLSTLGIDEEMTGTIEFEHTVSVGDDEFVIFGSTTPEAGSIIERMVEELPVYEHVNFREDGTRFDLRVSEPPVLSAIASLGGSVEEAVVEDGDYRLTLHLSPSTDVGELIDTVLGSFPDATLLRRTQLSNPRRDGSQGEALVGALTDRQLTVLETAYYAGFFEWPRAASGETVADSLDIAPPTFHQHLRKAEQTVFDGVFSTEH